MNLRIINNSEFDYLDIGFVFPVVDFYTKNKFIEGKVKMRRISLDTCIHYRSEDFFKYFTIRILGFGIYIARQWNY